jgi:hypothetical protein
LKELQSSTAEIGVSVHRITLSRTLHRVEIYGIVARQKPLIKERNKQTRLVFAKGHVGDSPSIWDNVLWRHVGDSPSIWNNVFWMKMRLKCSFLAIKENAISGANPTPLVTPKAPSPQ